MFGRHFEAKDFLVSKVSTVSSIRFSQIQRSRIKSYTSRTRTCSCARTFSIGFVYRIVSQGPGSSVELALGSNLSSSYVTEEFDRACD
jgi:hypothetical protein